MTELLLHEKVAWAWLDKMVGRTPTPVAEALTPRARATVLEKAYEGLREGLIASIRAELPLLVHAEETIATKYGLDPTFLDWFLINGKHWPSMAPKHRLALRAMQSCLIWFGAVPSQWNHMVVPEVGQGDDRDAALIELADWFLKNSLARIERRFVTAVWKKSRELLGIFGLPQAGDAKASTMLLFDFTRRLVGDAFQLKPAVQQIVDLLH
jgi:hypothetical protein